MPRESREAKSARARRIVKKLDAAMPETRIALEYENELQLLVAVMLSAQATDAVVNTVTPELFAKYRTAEDYARARVPELEKAIRRIGLFRGKARNLHAAMQRIAREHGGKLPRTREELYRLPGVGWKTAGVVVNHAFGTPALPVDTHVGRVSRRLGLTRQEDPDKVEAELSALLPPEQWGRAHQLLIWHARLIGRSVEGECSCSAPSPSPPRCSRPPRDAPAGRRRPRPAPRRWRPTRSPSTTSASGPPAPRGPAWIRTTSIRRRSSRTRGPARTSRSSSTSRDRAPTSPWTA